MLTKKTSFTRIMLEIIPMIFCVSVVHPTRSFNLPSEHVFFAYSADAMLLCTVIQFSGSLASSRTSSKLPLSFPASATAKRPHPDAIEMSGAKQDTIHYECSGRNATSPPGPSVPGADGGTVAVGGPSECFFRLQQRGPLSWSGNFGEGKTKTRCLSVETIMIIITNMDCNMDRQKR